MMGFRQSKHRPWHWVAQCFSLWLALVGTAKATTLTLANGDQLQGEIVAQTEVAVTLMHPILGQLVIPRTDLQVPNVADASPAPSAPLIPESDAPATTPEVVTAPPAPSTTPSVPTRRWMRAFENSWAFLAQYYPLQAWDNRIDLGLSMDTGQTNKTDLDLRFRAERKQTSREYLLSGRHRYSRVQSTNGVWSTNRDQQEGRFRFRSPLWEVFFLEADSRYRREPLKDLAHEAKQTLGIGYNWLEREGIRLTVTPALGAEYRDLFSEAPENALIASLAQDFSYTLTESISLRQEARISSDIQDTNNTEISFTSEVDNKLNQAISIILRYELSYDQFVSDQIERLQHHFSFALGTKF